MSKRGRASTLSSAEALHPALPLEGATQAPIEFIQRADASVEGEAPKALPLEGATQAPLNSEEVILCQCRSKPGGARIRSYYP
ncbi:MAG: hypothetical protein HZA13_03630 [Nitrospirae bacterium]|nr:hypothetical protein [Nitrospirota bacterium]